MFGGASLGCLFIPLDRPWWMHIVVFLVFSLWAWACFMCVRQLAHCRWEYAFSPAGISRRMRGQARAELIPNSAVRGADPKFSDGQLTNLTLRLVSGERLVFSRLLIAQARFRAALIHHARACLKADWATGEGPTSP
jgi:hypothetical protein